MSEIILAILPILAVTVGAIWLGILLSRRWTSNGLKPYQLFLIGLGVFIVTAIFNTYITGVGKGNLGLDVTYLALFIMAVVFWAATIVYAIRNRIKGGKYKASNTAKNRSNKSLVWSAVVTGVLVALGIGGSFGYQYYQNNRTDRIYAVGDSIKFSGFNFTVTKAQFKPVNLDLSQSYVKKYGAITTKENCNSFSDTPTYLVQESLVRAGVSGDGMGPSQYNICIRRNEDRDSAIKYMNANSQLAIDYSMHSSSTVNSKDIQLAVTPDSGRNVKASPQLYLGAFKKGAYEDFDTYGSDAGTLAGKTVYSLFGLANYDYDGYYGKSNLGGDVDNGLSRTGYVYTDIRKSEHTVDFKITYNGQSRLVRINR